MAHHQYFHIDTERDKKEILHLIYKYIENTYLDEINTELRTCRDRCERYPCKEARMLGMLAPTLPEEKRGKLDLIAELFVYNQVVEEANKRVNPYAKRAGNSQKSGLDELVIRLMLYYLVLSLES